VFPVQKREQQSRKAKLRQGAIHQNAYRHPIPTDDREAVEKILIETIRRIPTDGRELIARKK
jgi:hypothetical protein